MTQRKHFDDLVKLSNGAGSRFKIYGDCNLFTIRAASDNILFALLIFTLLFFPAILMLENSHNPNYRYLFLGVIAVILLYLRFYPTSNDIEFNTTSKTIKIQSNNLVGKYIVPKTEISFIQFGGLSFKKVSVHTKGATRHFNRIYISFNGKNQPMIDLPLGPFYVVDHQKFMDCLTGIIKGT